MDPGGDRRGDDLSGRATRLRTRLEVGLFPLDEPRRGRLPPAAVTLLALVLLAGATVTLLYRQGLQSATDSLYAEDGGIFYAQGLRHGLGAVFTPYRGYLHLLPRLIGAAVAAVSPLHDAAAAMSVTAAVIVGLLALVVYRAPRAFLPSPWPRFGLAALVVLAPWAAFETLDNVANLQWYLLVAGFWCLLWRPVAVGWVAVATAVTLFTAGSAPMALLLLPLALLRLALPAAPDPSRFAGRRWWPDVAPALGYLAGFAAQVAVMLTTSREQSKLSPDAGQVLHSYADRALLGGFVGPHLMGQAVAVMEAAAIALAVVVMLALLVLAVRDGEPRRWLAVAALLASLALYAAPTYFSWTSRFLPAGGPQVYDGVRYVVAPSLLVLAVAAAGLGVIGSRGAEFARWPLRALVVGAVVAGCVTGFSVHNSRDRGPLWSVTLKAAAARCAAPGGPASVRLWTAPPHTFAFWLSCQQILDDAGPTP